MKPLLQFSNNPKDGKTPKWSVMEERLPKGWRLVLEYHGLTLVSASLHSQSACEAWKPILLDRYHKIANGKIPDGVTQMKDGTYFVAGML